MPTLHSVTGLTEIAGAFMWNQRVTGQSLGARSRTGHAEGLQEFTNVPSFESPGLDASRDGRTTCLPFEPRPQIKKGETMNKHKSLLAACCILTVFLAGCGSSSHPATSNNVNGVFADAQVVGLSYT